MCRILLRDICRRAGALRVGILLLVLESRGNLDLYLMMIVVICMFGSIIYFTFVECKFVMYVVSKTRFELCFIFEDWRYNLNLKYLNKYYNFILEYFVFS
ncbi:hypothetical protein Hdeb2414_s0262g00851481 [Helianthus debilis subsp. tardiflorus]